MTSTDLQKLKSMYGCSGIYLHHIHLSFLEYEALYGKNQGVHFICFELTLSQLKSNFLVDSLVKLPLCKC